MIRQAFLVLSAALVACGGSVESSSDRGTPSTDAPSDRADVSSPSAPSPSPSTSPEPSPAPVGGCEYSVATGTATITTIAEPGPDDNACTNDGVVARFTFTPDDPSAPAVPAQLRDVDEGNRAIMQGSKFAASGCLKELGLEVGSTFRVKRSFVTKGTCTPIIYAPEINVATCKTACDL